MNPKTNEASISINARAKLNLTLEVDGVRADSYHELWSIMCEVSLCDHITITLSSTPGIRIHSNVSLPKKNTLSSSAELFLREYSLKYGQDMENSGVDITIQKNIPSEAGLGGGSSDAAATLHALNRLFPYNKFTQAELLSMAAKIGSDVPFFIEGGFAVIGGRGEVVNTLDDGLKTYFRAHPAPVVIVQGKRGISTPALFKLYDQTALMLQTEDEGYSKLCRERLVSAITCSDKGTDWDVFRELGRNDLEAAAVSLLDEIRSAKELLYESGAKYALMTGSGSAVYGIFGEGEEKRAAIAASKLLDCGYPFVYQGRLIE